MKNRNCSLNELINEKVFTLNLEQRYGSAYNYRTLGHYIEKNYGLVPMKDVSPKWASGLHQRLTKEGKSPSTIKCYFALLQSITNYAAYLGATKGDVKLTRSKPYELDKVKLGKVKTRQNKWLTRDEMDRLWKYWTELPDKPKGEKRWLGLFMASYLCNGCNIADLVRIKYDDEYYTSDKKLLGFYREKTKNTSGAYVRIPITEKLRTIIDTIGDPEERNGRVFGNYLKDVDTNDEVAISAKVMMLNSFGSKVVRKICKKLGMREDVSMTFARHSFASVLNLDGCNYALIERSLGHVLGGVADHYIANGSVDSLFELNSHLFSN